MEDSKTKNNIKKEIQIEEISSIMNKNKLNSSRNESQNQIDENANKNQIIEDEEGNLLDPDDLSYNSEEDQNSVIIFDI